MCGGTDLGPVVIEGLLMDVWRITVAALRRWYVLVPLLGLTAMMVLFVGRGVQAEYEVTGTTMLVPGRALPRVPNPYGSPDDANNAVVIVLDSPKTRGLIAERGLVGDYEVAPQSRSTIMNFQVRDASPEIALETGMAVFDMAAAELGDRQTAAGIRIEEQYRMDVLQAPSVSEAVTEGKLRVMAVVGVLGGAISLAVAVFFDDVVGLLGHRRRRVTQARQDAQRMTGMRGAEGPARTLAEPPETGRDLPSVVDRKQPGGSARQPAPTSAQQPRRGKKAAAADSSESAVSASRGAAVSDAR